MPDWFDSPADIAADLTILIAILAAITWLLKMKVDKIVHEMFPNSGKSMRDAIDRIEAKLDSHIDWHMDRNSDG